LENLLDPAHVPFAHHGLLQGNRAEAIPISLSTHDDRTEKGFSFSYRDRIRKKYCSNTAMFRAPYVLRFESVFDRNEQQVLQDYNSSASSVENVTAGEKGRSWFERRLDRRSSRSGRNRAADNESFSLSFIVIPTRPGWSRVISFYTNPEQKAIAEFAQTFPGAADDDVTSEASMGKSVSAASQPMLKKAALKTIPFGKRLGFALYNLTPRWLVGTALGYAWNWSPGA
jgi:phenylpropionate dioxygenase-like ring-hydroxylating dioxygenase large terminal subunit